MYVKEAIAAIDYELVQGSVDTYIESISCHAKHIDQDSLFVCMQGIRADGHDYIAQAVMKGASAIMVERKVALEFIPSDCTVLQVKDARAVLPAIASAFYEGPSKSFHLYGIAGTHGISPVAHFLSLILESQEKRHGHIGTIQPMEQKQKRHIRFPFSTPEASDLQHTFHQMKKEAITDVIMDISTLEHTYHRVDGCSFDTILYMGSSFDTNWSESEIEHYTNKMSQLLSENNQIIVNHAAVSNDPLIDREAPCITFGTDSDADYYASNVQNDGDYITFTFHGAGIEEGFTIPTGGDESVLYATAAVTIALQNGVEIDLIRDSLYNARTFHPTERMITEEGYSLLVENTHSLEELEKLMFNVRANTPGKIITVMDVEIDEHHVMRNEINGPITDLSDYLILTTNPSSSVHYASIVQRIEEVIMEADYEIMENRDHAIERGMLVAEEGDTIFITSRHHQQEIMEKWLGEADRPSLST
ncbi:Mur ligase family protein [Pontibacillus salicampi]|uniref:Mur ligase family protein n=1 Tax=Pontibacillus salicampi TaxID=1449801 RepID=A0ABV6LRU5_9BACI